MVVLCFLRAGNFSSMPNIHVLLLKIVLQSDEIAVTPHTGLVYVFILALGRHGSKFTPVFTG